MGGKNKRYTVGFKYKFGLHAVLCQSPIDGLLQIDFADRRAWSGKAINRRISINASKLFGGEAREGGVSGFVDVEGGLPTQGQNSYLAGRLGGLVPNFRGVVGLVFRKFYWGNNPYPKAWRAKVQNVFSTYQGWLPSLAPINAEASFDRTAIYIALDDSGSMRTGTRLATMKTAVNRLLDQIPLNDKVAVRIVKWGATIGGTTTHYGFTSSARNACKSFVSGIGGDQSATDFAVALSTAGAFFSTADSTIPVDKGSASPFQGASSGGSQIGESGSSDSLKRIIIFVTDGEPARTPSAPPQTIVNDALAIRNAVVPAPEVFAINIDLADTQYTSQLDSDGFVPVIEDGQEDELADVLSASFSSFADLNAAHILRDMLISPTNDGSGDPSQIGDSFAQAAQVLFREGLGLSLFWNNPSDRDGFKRMIEDHISGVSFFDQTTGKWELKLIRPDYTIGSLFTFNSSNIVDWSEPPERPIFQELPNQITLKYTRRDNGEPTSVTVTNIAGVQETARVINEVVSMPGITWPELANKVAERELVARGTPLLKGAFKASYMPSDLNIGSAFLLTESRLGINSLACRIIEIEETDGKDNSVLIRFVEDVFATNMEQPAIASGDAETPPLNEAIGPDATLAFELPYYELIRILGESDLAFDLSVDQDLGYWGATCTRPNSSHINAQVAVLNGSDYLEVGYTPFAPAWTLRASISASAAVVTFTADETGSEPLVAVGDLMFIENEIVRVDSIAVSGGVATFTIGRGCLDTVPAPHGKGSSAFLFQDLYVSDLVEYTAGEDITVKVLPATAIDVWDLNEATPQTISMGSRAFSPYPVGRLQIESSYLPSGILSGIVTATWAHRDRLSQTTALVEDHADGNIGPEAGVSYTPVARVIQLHDDLFTASTNLFALEDFFASPTPLSEIEYNLSPEDALTYDFDLDDVEIYADEKTLAIDLGVITRRGSPAYENFQTPFVRVKPLLAPISLYAESEGSPSPSPSSP